MNTKCIGGGNTLGYMKSRKDKMGLKREQEPEKLLGNPELARALLELQAAPVVREEDQSRRQTAHLRRRLTHLMNCNSERQAVVEPHLKRVCRHTQDLLLAGLPRESLAFVWYKHGQAIGTHAHGALIHSLLTGGGPYEPNLRAALLQRSDRLVSRALGLSDPLDPARAMLALSCWASWKEDNIPLIKEVIARTQELWRAGELRQHRDFEEKVLLEQAFEVLVSPRPDGQPEVRIEFCHEPHLPKYCNCVAARKEDHLIVFRGPICRPGFNAARQKTSLERRQRKVDELRQSPWPLFQEFQRLLKERMDLQRDLYGMDGAQDSVKEADFEWLLSEPAPKLDPEDTPEKELERVIGFPEAFYPYCCDDQEITWSVSDPRIATEKVQLDPLLAEMESDQEVVWPRQWLPQDEAKRQEEEKIQLPQPWFEFESDGEGPRGPGPLPAATPQVADSPAGEPKSILGGFLGRFGLGHGNGRAEKPAAPVARPRPTPAPAQSPPGYQLRRLLHQRTKKLTPRQRRARFALQATQETGRSLQNLAAAHRVAEELAAAAAPTIPEPKPTTPPAPAQEEGQNTELPKERKPSVPAPPQPAAGASSKPSPQQEPPKPEPTPPDPPPPTGDSGID